MTKPAALLSLWLALRAIAGQTLCGLPDYGAVHTAASCEKRDLGLLDRTILEPDATCSANIEQSCRARVGGPGWLEQCCSLHAFDSSGFGNQLLQLAHAIRLARHHRCTALCLPACVTGQLEASLCSYNGMWHQTDNQQTPLHIASVFSLSRTIKLPAALPDNTEPDGPTYAGVSCASGHRPGMTSNAGWPYCYFHWQFRQMAVDLGQVLGRQKHYPLPEDHLVVHIRSGDSVLEVMDWITKDATTSQYDEASIVNTAIQPACSFYLDAARSGFNGGAFAKVHVMVDLRCEGDSYDEILYYRKQHGKDAEHVDPKDCESTNPCLLELMNELPDGVLVLPPAGMTQHEAFERDVQLMARARNIAITCSTFSMFGRLMAVKLQRLFVPNCQLLYQVSEDAIKNGRRRANMQAGKRKPLPWFFHPGWNNLIERPQPFSASEPLEISWYDFDWQNSSILHAALGSKVYAPTEWKLLTNSSAGNPITRLLTEVNTNKTVMDARAEAAHDSKLAGPTASLPVAGWCGGGSPCSWFGVSEEVGQGSALKEKAAEALAIKALHGTFSDLVSNGEWIGQDSPLLSFKGTAAPCTMNDNRQSCIMHWKYSDTKAQLNYEAQLFETPEVQNLRGPYETNSSHDHIYAWFPHRGRLSSFSPDGFCAAIKGGMLFIGDSISSQHWEQLRIELKGARGSCADWYPERLEPEQRWRQLGCTSFSACGVKFVYIRNDWLAVEPWGQLGPMQDHAQRYCDNSKPNAFCLSWADPAVLSLFRYIIVNAGAHYRPDSIFVPSLTKARNVLNEHKSSSPATTVIFRTTVPGVGDCSEQFDTPPLSSVQAAEEHLRQHPWFEGLKLKEQSNGAAQMFLCSGNVVLDVYSSSIRRLDVHRDNGDCLHYRVPGVLPHWNRLLYNLLLNTSETLIRSPACEAAAAPSAAPTAAPTGTPKSVPSGSARIQKPAQQEKAAAAERATEGADANPRDIVTGETTTSAPTAARADLGQRRRRLAGPTASSPVDQRSAQAYVQPGQVTQWFEALAKPCKITMPIESKPQVHFVKVAESDVFDIFTDVFKAVCGAQDALFVDSGANDGLWSLMASCYGCKAIAIEPQMLCVQLLAAAAVESKLELEFHHNLLSDQRFSTTSRVDECQGSVQFTSDGKKHDATDAARDHNSDGTRPMAAVNSTSLDTIVGPTGVVELWHIGTEGAEINVLKSAAGLFAGGRIKRAMIEWVPGRWHRFGVNVADGLVYARDLFGDWRCQWMCREGIGPALDWDTADQMPNVGLGQCFDIYCINPAVNNDIGPAETAKAAGPVVPTDSWGGAPTAAPTGAPTATPTTPTPTTSEEAPLPGPQASNVDAVPGKDAPAAHEMSAEEAAHTDKLIVRAPTSQRSAMLDTISGDVLLLVSLVLSLVLVVAGVSYCCGTQISQQCSSICYGHKYQAVATSATDIDDHVELEDLVATAEDDIYSPYSI